MSSTTVHLCYISLGSNLGDRLDCLTQAARQMQSDGNKILTCSSVYVTEPVEMQQQPDFLNLVLGMETVLPCQLLLRKAQSIESRLGRKRVERFGPRTIDLDILFYGEEIIRTPCLEIPHPRLHLRRFVLVPLREIAPGLRHPVLSLTVEELLERAPDRSRVERYCGPVA
jgi:2-amino-4-hydroxy-6-hydroxymethyldihydropteridine diphosphokinase